MRQKECYLESLGFKEAQNQKILKKLREWYFVPTNIIKKISSQYNRSISDLRKDGNDIKSVRRYGVNGFMLV